MPELHAQLATSLGAAYTVERELGGGGMSRVFMATDTTLGRRVVIKVLSPDMAPGVSVERFKREIAFAARLQHPHIVPLLAAGEADGAPYFTMPLIEGESLRDRLTRTGELPIAEAVRLLREVGSALAYAHGKGIVHRDIKPENILLTAQHSFVTDFGVAKALSEASEGASGLTSVGLVLGTPAYMAPEQAAGEATTDHRADLYALGVVAYEVLAGQTPFAGRSPQAVMAAHLTETPESLAARRPSVPPALAALVMRCLEKRPSDRPQRAEELVRDLDHVSPSRASTSHAQPSVAVLPMVNTSGDPENEHFSDGLTDELIGALCKVPELTVSGRTSAFALKGKGLSVRAIADTLGVANVLEGSVRRAGDRLKVRVQLVNADGSVRWSEAYDRTLTDVFAVQEEIARAVVAALEIHLGAARGPLVRPAPTDLIAYDLFLKGRYYRRRLTAADLRRATDYFEQAIARDATYASAYAWLCNAHVLLVVFGGRPAREEVDRARAYAAKAVALDGTLSDAHWALAEVLMALDRNWPAAGREYQRALALDPGNVDARHLYAIYLLAQRRTDEAMAELTRTLSADPLLAEAHMTVGRLYMSTGQPLRAIACLREAVELSPTFSFARGQLGHAYLQQGMRDDAIAEFERAAADGGARDSAQLAYAYAVVGRIQDARRLLAKLLAGDQGYPPPFHVSMAYVGLGDADEAFRWLERAYAEHDPWLGVGLNVAPAFEPLQADRRFTELVRRLGLAP